MHNKFPPSLGGRGASLGASGGVNSGHGVDKKTVRVPSP